MQLNQSDLELLKSKNIKLKDLENQLNTFKNGIPFAKILDSATVGKGIVKIPNEQKQSYIDLYDNSDIKVVKFTPSSGAATRMFKVVHEFFNGVKLSKEGLERALNQEKFKLVKQLVEGIEKLSFYHDAVESAESRYSNFDKLSVIEQLVLSLKAAIDHN